MRGRPEKWTHDKAIAAVLEFRAREGRWPMHRDMRQANGLPAVVGKFGGVNQLKLDAGWVPPPPALKPPPKRRPEHRGMQHNEVPAEPVRRLIRRAMAEQGLNTVQAAEKTRGNGPWGQRRFYDLMNHQKFVQSDTADRMLCALGMHWSDDPELAEHYERVTFRSGCSICGKQHPVGRKAAA